MQAPAQTSPAPASAFGRLVDALNAIGSIVIGLVMLLMCTDVAMRNLANRPVDGVAELVATSIVVIVFLQLPATLRHGRLSRAELFIDPFVARRPAAGHALLALYALCGVFGCVVIAWSTWPLTVRAWEDGLFFGVEGVFTFPTWPMRAVVVLGSAVAALQFALLGWQDARTAMTRAGT